MTSQEVVSDGSLVGWALTLEFFSRDEITLTFDGVAVAPGTGVWDWSGPTGSTIVFSPAVANGVVVLATRTTSAEAMRHSFSGGAQFKTAVLDENFTQLLRLAQEYQDAGEAVPPGLFDSRYIGVREDPPTVDANGNPLVQGSLYVAEDGGVRSRVAGVWLDYAGSLVSAVSAALAGASGYTLISGGVARLSALAASAGSALVGFIQSGLGAVARTASDKLRENVSITDFGCVGDGATDNTAALAAVVSYLNTFVGTGLLPKVTIPAGTYKYATSPNWGITGLCLEAHGEVIFQHTGSGTAFNIDGGAAGGGAYGVRILGRLRVSGNANTVAGVYVRALHHSYISVRPINCETALQTAWCVCTEFDVRCSPLGYPGFTKVPTVGMLLGERGVGEQTSACIFYNPIMEGITAYGINLQSASLNTFLGGTSEANAGGVYLAEASIGNKFVGLDMETNSAADVLCLGSYNVFEGIYSDTTSTFGGTHNIIRGGLFNSIVNNGTKNAYRDLNYAIGGGTFTTGSMHTIKSGVRSSTSGLYDVDMNTIPKKLMYIDGAVGNNTVMGSDDQIGGGSSSDFSIYHYGAAEFSLWANGTKRVRMDGTGLGFQGATPIAKPVITGSRGGNVALANVLTQLAAYGLITDSTTV